MKKTICGVDVSKAKLDVCIEPVHRLASFNNDTAGIAELAAFCRERAVTLVVMEASGGYERRAFVERWENGISCALTNPRNVRRYAEAMGILEKTDRIDSSVIARFAHAKNLAPTPLPSQAQQRFKAWLQGSGRSPTTLRCKSSAAPACSITRKCDRASTR
ncbi:transposase [Bradyrhizobium sp. F1.13.3]|uniref:IS110 family transposase n=1 Tax=Bradyrhizobium sp. F1.13.3 TaxID=3156351 RepID=UPI003398121D